jgi:hypothetical protein
MAAWFRALVRICVICGVQNITGQFFSEYFDFPCQVSFHRLLHTHHLSSGAGTIGQIVADIPSRLSLTLLQETKKDIHLLNHVTMKPSKDPQSILTIPEKSTTARAEDSEGNKNYRIL